MASKVSGGCYIFGFPTFCLSLDMFLRLQIRNLSTESGSLFSEVIHLIKVILIASAGKLPKIELIKKPPENNRRDILFCFSSNGYIKT